MAYLLQDREYPCRWGLGRQPRDREEAGLLFQSSSWALHLPYQLLSPFFSWLRAAHQSRSAADAERHNDAQGEVQKLEEAKILQTSGWWHDSLACPAGWRQGQAQLWVMWVARGGHVGGQDLTGPAAWGQRSDQCLMMCPALVSLVSLSEPVKWKL